MNLSVITFNCMGLFSFDTLHGFLLSLNITDRVKTIGDHLAKESADIIMLQEVHTYFVLRMLKKKLSQYPYVAYQPSWFGAKGGLVIFSKHPLEQVSYINYKKRGSFFNKSFVTRLIQNGILTAEIKNTSVSVCNTYLTPNMDYDHSKKNRFTKFSEAQLRQLAEIGKILTQKGNHVLIGGDFNIDKKGYLYKVFLDLSQATDLFAHYNSPTKIQEFYPKNKTVERLDYLFHIGKTKPKEITTTHLFTEKVKINNKTTTYLSDHIGLQATLDIA
ncbi:MAG TPA: endonuclease/exonuclease/phosphatase family protein [Patescibacteria group bacterium]|nr:endonuclease/exonuclease/phosphatase family protein [Patescibacteria group bacterium]